MKPRLLLARLCDLCHYSYGRQRALTAFLRHYLLKKQTSDRMIKQLLLNSVIAKYRDKYQLFASASGFGK